MFEEPANKISALYLFEFWVVFELDELAYNFIFEENQIAFPREHHEEVHPCSPKIFSVEKHCLELVVSKNTNT